MDVRVCVFMSVGVCFGMQPPYSLARRQRPEVSEMLAVLVQRTFALNRLALVNIGAACCCGT